MTNLVERSTDQMKCTTNEEEATGAEYDVERTKYYKKNSLQNEFSSVMAAFTPNTIARARS